MAKGRRTTADDSDAPLPSMQRRHSFDQSGQPAKKIIRRTIPLHHRERVMRMFEMRKGPIRWQEFRNAGVDDHALRELVREGAVLYPAVGIFAAPGDYEPRRFALSVLKAHGTEFYVCLKTAALMHGLISVDDQYIWLVLPSTRKTLREIGGYEPIPVRWNSMQVPDDPIMLDEGDKASVDWHPEMSELEQTERFLGINREWGYGGKIKVTTPARTVCDLLAFKDRPIGREGLNGLSISSDVAFEALKNYCLNSDIAEAKEIAYRVGYGDDLISMLDMGKYMTTQHQP
jgi:hypothetical protein